MTLVFQLEVLFGRHQNAAKELAVDSAEFSEKIQKTSLSDNDLATPGGWAEMIQWHR
jgi:hypothetical protein